MLVCLYLLISPLLFREVLELYQTTLQVAQSDAGGTQSAQNIKDTWALKLEQLKGELAQLDHAED